MPRGDFFSSIISLTETVPPVSARNIRLSKTLLRNGAGLEGSRNPPEAADESLNAVGQGEKHWHDRVPGMTPPATSPGGAAETADAPG